MLPQELLDLASGRVLRLVVPDYVEVDEVEARLLPAIELFREGCLSLKQAASLAGLCVEDFMRELHEGV